MLQSKTSHVHVNAAQSWKIEWVTHILFNPAFSFVIQSISEKCRCDTSLIVEYIHPSETSWPGISYPMIFYIHKVMYSAIILNYPRSYYFFLCPYCNDTMTAPVPGRTGTCSWCLLHVMHGMYKDEWTPFMFCNSSHHTGSRLITTKTNESLCPFDNVCCFVC